ncbi:MAG: hypothetical protein DRP67_02195 [Candidatus Omnitrophota bacterium]|nr:MAG: hypothetical protein DRP67_02195 [Candidatus Omnitrophota bacterium]
MERIIDLIVWTFLIGLFIRVLPERTKFLREFLTLITTLVLFVISIIFFVKKPLPFEKNYWFIFDSLSIFTFLATTFFGFIVSIYSIPFMKGKEFLSRYYAYILWTISASIGAIFSNHLILFTLFWGFLGFSLYMLINVGGEKASFPAKKTFIIVGGSDSFLILGVILIWILSGSFLISEAKISIVSRAGYVAFLCLLIASLAKAGAFPLHTWIPEISESAPTSVMAFLPASLDKLLGIYLLSRICLNLFNFHEGMWFLLRFIGAFTIVAGVMMAIVQHNMKKLLSYHAVSQVGYMVLGISTANPIGIIGGLFHMLNNAIYKCALFMGAGAVEEKTKTTELERLGGLSTKMPLTFTCFLIASLAISGVPPFNGFFSKWFIYQGLFEGAKSGDPSWAIWIISAMIGSALTLASFLKIIHSVFLGHKKEYEGIGEVSFLMILPSIILALLCIIFGFGFTLPINLFFKNIVGVYPSLKISLISPGLTVLVISLIFGLIMFILLSTVKVKRARNFIGGEIQTEEMAMSGTEFYRTVYEIGFFKQLYKGAEKKIFDIYEILRNIVFYIGGILKFAHNGVLLNYLSWILFGVLILLFLFKK